MLVKPSELPTAAEANIEPALEKVAGWRLDNSGPSPKNHEVLEFVEKHAGSFFDSMRQAFKLIDRPALK